MSLTPHEPPTNPVKDEAYIDRLVNNIAERIRCQAQLIRDAVDPMAMLERLRPILIHPGVNGGEIPPVFRHIAEDEVVRRTTAAATAAPATQH